MEPLSGGHTALLLDIVVIAILGVLVVSVCVRLRLPVIVGFFVTGMLAGPHGLGLVRAVSEVEFLAEIGVVLLLFTVGVEFSLRRLWRIRTLVVVGGGLQLAFTVGLVWLIAHWAGVPVMEALVWGILISLSSTAIVLKLLQQAGLIDSPHGKAALGILIFQDLMVVPLMLILPLLGGPQGIDEAEVALVLAKGFGVVAAVVALAYMLVPRLMYHVARTGSREAFVLSIAALCFAVALLTHQLGLSLALGAFLAGLTIADSEYGQQAFAQTQPFRDVLTSVFFVSVGMLLDGTLLLQAPLLLIGAAVGVLLLKTIVTTSVLLVLGLPLRVALLAGVALCQVGEFSFVLSKVALAQGVLERQDYQFFLAFSVLTMAMTPFLLSASPWLARTVGKLSLPSVITGGWRRMRVHDGTAKAKLENHLIIVGFGVNGKNVARAAELAGIPFLALELNAETVQKERAAGRMVRYGDAAQPSVLQHVGVASAQALVVAIADSVAARAIVSAARAANPGLFIIVRTRLVAELPELMRLGANLVIPEEFETSVEIFAQVLKHFSIPGPEIERLVTQIREDGYRMFSELIANRNH